jgi:hypothetical protein
MRHNYHGMCYQLKVLMLIMTAECIIQEATNGFWEDQVFKIGRLLNVSLTVE